MLELNAVEIRASGLDKGGGQRIVEQSVRSSALHGARATPMAVCPTALGNSAGPELKRRSRNSPSAARWSTPSTFGLISAAASPAAGARQSTMSGWAQVHRPRANMNRPRPSENPRHALQFSASHHR